MTVTDDGGSSDDCASSSASCRPATCATVSSRSPHHDSPFKPLLQHRFDDESGQDGHPVGNLLLTALAQITGDFSQAIDQLGAMIGSRGRVMPTTTRTCGCGRNSNLANCSPAKREIVRQPSPIRRLSLEPSPRPLPHVLRALVNAEGIVVGPAASTRACLPNLLVEGVAATIYGVNAVRIYVANLMTEPGETDGYTLDDHLRVIRTHTGFDLFDYILVNRRPIDEVAARPVCRAGIGASRRGAHSAACWATRRSSSAIWQIEWGGQDSAPSAFAGARHSGADQSGAATRTLAPS